MTQADTPIHARVRILLLLWPAICAIALACEATRDTGVCMPVIDGEPNIPVVAVYVRHMGTLVGPDSRPVPRDALNIIMVAWRSGRIIWSEDDLRGGPPYFNGDLDPYRLENILKELRNKGVFDRPELNHPNFGPDSDFTVLAIADRGRRLEMGSWHELVEGSSNHVATSYGLESLRGRDRAEVLKSQPAKYRRYRQVWQDVRAALTGLVPDEGEPISDLQFRLVQLDPAGNER